MNAETYPLTLFYDGACPVCRHEMHALRRRDTAARLRFEDVRAPGFVAPDGTTVDAMLAAIHGRRADGRVIVGVETLRLAYRAVGLGWLLAPTAWGPLRALSERGYRWFARHRFAAPTWLAIAAFGRRPHDARCDDTHCPF